MFLFLNYLTASIDGDGKGKKENQYREDAFGERYKEPIPTSGDYPHQDPWNEAIKVFQSMKFVKKRSRNKERPNVMNNFIHTLKGFKLLRRKFDNYGFTHFGGRLFNQDPIENLFGQIRQHAVRNVKPNTTLFEDYYKSILVNTITDNNLKGTNCEGDSSSGFLVSIKSLLQMNANDSSS